MQFLLLLLNATVVVQVFGRSDGSGRSGLVDTAGHW